MKLVFYLPIQQTTGKNLTWNKIEKLDICWIIVLEQKYSFYALNNDLFTGSIKQTYWNGENLGKNHENTLHLFRHIQSHSNHLKNFMKMISKICMVIEIGEKEAGKAGRAMTSMKVKKDLKRSRYKCKKNVMHQKWWVINNDK